MKQQVTEGIILSRINYGEADRILTVLTVDCGKLSLMARGVRKNKSKLAGGIELFSISQITFIRGRGEIGTLTSSRLKVNFAEIVKDLARTQLGYELLKLTNRNTETETEADYFHLLRSSLEALNTPKTPSLIIKLYFEANLLKLAGHAPNLSTDNQGRALAAEHTYGFSVSDASFAGSGEFTAHHIKYLRLVFAGNSPNALARVSDAEQLARKCEPLLSGMVLSHLRT